MNLLIPQAIDLVGMLPRVDFAEDFDCATAALGAAGGRFILTDTGDATEALVADATGGVLSLALAATSEAEVAACSMGDERQLRVQSDLIFECRVKLAVLPSAAGTLMRWGLAADHNTTFDSNTHHLWFGAEGSGAVFVEMDDTVTDDDDNATGKTVLTTGWHTYRIDARNIADIRFFIDGVQVCQSEKFAWAAAQDVNLQPYFCALKASGTSVGTMYIDFWRGSYERAA